jgi:hypothetical protein
MMAKMNVPPSRGGTSLYSIAPPQGVNTAILIETMIGTDHSAAF